MSAASARRVSVATSVLTSSVWNWIQARVIVAPAGIWRLVKRSPTRWTLVPSVTSSRSELDRSTEPVGPLLGVVRAARDRGLDRGDAPPVLPDARSR